MSRRKYLNEEGFDKWWYDMLANKGITPTHPDSASGWLAWEHQAKRIAELEGDNKNILSNYAVLEQQLVELREAARAYLEMNNPVNSNKLEALL